MDIGKVDIGYQIYHRNQSQCLKATLVLGRQVEHYGELRRQAIAAVEAELQKLKRRRYQVRILADSTVIVDADSKTDAESKVQYAITKGTSPYIALHFAATQLDNPRRV